MVASTGTTTCAAAAAMAIAALAPRDARAYHAGDERLIDDTAHTLRSGEIRAGMLSLDVGTVGFASLGTDTLPWAASLYLSSVLGNGHVKIRVLYTAPLTLAVRGAVFYGAIDEKRGDRAASGHLLLVPVSLFSSSDLTGDLSLHLEATYTRFDARGELEFPGSGHAALAASAVQVGMMLEYRFSRTLAAILVYRHQPYASPAVVRTSGDDVATGARVMVDGNVATSDSSTFAVTSGIVVSNAHMNLRLGGGYGSVFLPAMGVALPWRSVIPELDFYVRF